MKINFESPSLFDLSKIESSVIRILNDGSLTSSRSISKVRIVTLPLSISTTRGSDPFSGDRATEVCVVGRTLAEASARVDSSGSTRWIPPIIRNCPCRTVQAGMPLNNVCKRYNSNAHLDSKTPFFHKTKTISLSGTTKTISSRSSKSPLPLNLSIFGEHIHWRKQKSTYLSPHCTHS